MRISICVPVHDMPNGDYFLNRLHRSLDRQTFQNFEVIITKEGRMAENTNAAIKLATGEIIKILYLDDFLWSDQALQNIHDSYTGGWMASGCVHTENERYFHSPHVPSYNPDIRSGNNTIGSPSVVAFANEEPLLFDENLSWLLDVELYSRLYERYGEPTIIPTLDVAIGLHPGQTTHTMSDRAKQEEFIYLQTKNG